MKLRLAVVALGVAAAFLWKMIMRYAVNQEQDLQDRVHH